MRDSRKHNSTVFVKSNLKYAYIAVFFTLLSGVFYPLIYNTSLLPVVLGVTTLFVGLGGGILIFKSTEEDPKRQQGFMTIGVMMMIVSTCFIFILSGRVF